MDCRLMQPKDAGSGLEANASALSLLRDAPPYRRGGYVSACVGGSILAVGLGRHAGVGTTCQVEGTGAAGAHDAMLAEVVGFSERGATLLPYGQPQGVRSGARVVL